MEYYPRITDKQNTVEPACWEIMPLENVLHDGILGLMKGSGLSILWQSKADVIPETFYGKELVAFATGSDEEVIALSKEYGLLVSPFRRAISAWQEMDRIFTQADSPSEGGQRIRRLTSDPRIPDLEQILGAIKTIERATDKEVEALHDSIALTDSQRFDEKNRTGIVVSLAEIRATAARLLDAQKVIKAISDGVSVSGLSDLVDKGGLPSFPIQKLRYIEYCLRDSGLFGISLTLEDEQQNMANEYDFEDLEISVIDGEAEINALRQWSMLNSIRDARPKEPITFTEAVARGLRNLAIENRKWAQCEKCGNEFPLTAGKLRKVKKPQGTYCSVECRNAASQKRYREKRKLADTSAQ
jgi:hypothetical protein